VQGKSKTTVRLTIGGIGTGYGGEKEKAQGQRTPYLKIFMDIKFIHAWWHMHACNPSSLGGRGRRIITEDNLG
jgi:hypothetical protein